MRKATSLFKYCVGLAWLLGSYLSTSAQPAERIIPDSLMVPDQIRCGSTAAFFQSLGQGGATGSGTGGAQANFSTTTIPLSNFAPGDIRHCGRFDIYYEDILTPGGGFTDPVLGLTRQGTFCAVLTYLQDVFDFSNIQPGAPIRIFVHRSFSPAYPAPAGTTAYAEAGPNFDNSTPGITAGYVQRYTATGVDPANNAYHAEMQMNFDQVFDPNGNPVPFAWHDDYTTNPLNCELDLFTSLLHEMGHVLGWNTMITYAATIPVANPSGVYSTIDNNVYSGFYDPPLPFDKLLNAGILTSNMSVRARSNYWIGNGPAPYNIPLASYPGRPELNIAHVDDELNAYAVRARISPGNTYPYVMGPFGVKGQARRVFTKYELEIIKDKIGYSFTSTFAATNSAVLNNRAPYSRKMLSLFSGLTSPNDYLHSNEDNCMSAEVPPLINTPNASVTLLLANDGNLQDDDGDPIYAVESSIVNLRGAGRSNGTNGGNNHDCITPLRNSTNDVIGFTYLPRPGFEGRCQFGFDLWDKKGKGAFVVYTIDVLKNPGAVIVPGSELVINGGFEEGTEVRTLINETPANTTVDLDGTSGGKFMLGTHYSDTHPFARYATPYSNYPAGIGIKDAYVSCAQSATRKYGYGSLLNSFPSPTGFLLHYPDVAAYNPGSGKRYYTTSSLGTGYGAFLPLTTKLQDCKNYLFEFDAAMPLGGAAAVEIGFTDAASISCSSGIGWSTGYVYPNFVVPQDPVNLIGDANNPIPTTWKHFSVPFNYCNGSGIAEVLLMRFHQASGNDILLDNVSLKQVTVPPAIVQTDLNNCADINLAAVWPGCNLTYAWTRNGQPAGTTADITVTRVLGDVYDVTITDPCGNTVTASTTIVPSATCNCATSTFGFGNYTPLAGTITSLPSNFSGYYYVPDNLSISGNVLMSGKVIIAGDGATITVLPGSTLDLSHTHILTCPNTANTWKGIDVSSGAKLIIRDNSLIEDAAHAVVAHQAAAPAGGNVLTIDNSVFNRNTTSISIGYYNSTATGYPFAITRNVISSRNLGTFTNYPFQWPTADALQARTSNTSPAPPAGQNIESYPFALLKDGKQARTGVSLDHVGTSGGGNYYGLQIGGAQQGNTFDNMGSGIEAYNTNLSAYNNSFLNMKPLPGTPALGTGIYSQATPGVLDAQLQVIGLSGGANTFYNCATAVQGTDLFDVVGAFANMTSSHTYPGTADNGVYGYNLQSKKYARISLTYNDIYNITNGIFCSATDGPGYLQGSVTINNNHLGAHPPLVANNPQHFMRQGILVQNLVTNTGNGVVTGSINIGGNSLTRLYNGIAASNLTIQPPSIGSNAVALDPEATATAQYGISMTNCPNGVLTINTVTAAVQGLDKMRAFYLSASGGTKVTCNTAKDIDRGFDFVGAQSGTLWRENIMNNNRRGFILGGVIGQQGAPTGLGNLAASNAWQGTWGGANFQTYTENSALPVNSKLYVRPGVSYFPSSNSGIFNIPQFIYSSTNGLISTNAATSVNCPPAVLPSNARNAQSLVARNVVPYDGSEARQQWMAQMALWQGTADGFIMADDEDAGPEDLQAIADFRDGAQGTRFRWLTDVENYLGSEQWQEAADLLSQQPDAQGAFGSGTAEVTDLPEADEVVANYVTYYQLLLRYHTQNLDDKDHKVLAQLANLCPVKDGTVIYQARALYQLVTGTLTIWDDDQCATGAIAGRGIIGENTAGTQQYSLSPNPNNGAIVLQQAQGDEQPVSATLINAAGSTVHTTILHFQNKIAFIERSGLSAGLYLLRLTQSNGQSFNLKFMVQ